MYISLKPSGPLTQWQSRYQRSAFSHPMWSMVVKILIYKTYQLDVHVVNQVQTKAIIISNTLYVLALLFDFCIVWFMQVSTNYMGFASRFAFMCMHTTTLSSTASTNQCKITNTVQMALYINSTMIFVLKEELNRQRKT